MGSLHKCFVGSIMTSEGHPLSAEKKGVKINQVPYMLLPCHVHGTHWPLAVRTDVCSPDPCALIENAECRPIAGEPFCFCEEGYENIGSYQSSSSNRPDGGITCVLEGGCWGETLEIPTITSVARLSSSEVREHGKYVPFNSVERAIFWSVVRCCVSSALDTSQIPPPREFRVLDVWLVLALFSAPSLKPRDLCVNETDDRCSVSPR